LLGVCFVKAFVMARLRSLSISSAVALLCVGALPATLMFGGCAGTSASQAAAVGGPTGGEADGLPAQVHPAADIRQLPDDPAQPFRPNYGSNDAPQYGPKYGPNYGPNYGSPYGYYDPAAALPARRFGSPFSAAEEEAIIAAAITAHETLRP
jgi:hypothetical protein